MSSARLSSGLKAVNKLNKMLIRECYIAGKLSNMTRLIREEHQFYTLD